MPNALLPAVERILRPRWLYHVGALVLTSIFWWSGLSKIFGFAQASAHVPRWHA
ncbi:hypothetical protein GCM10010975_36800 [Comamonas phosphati]|nr:hypothetical protein GCM10010975_36800 [Comamonas phosphati]